MGIKHPLIRLFAPGAIAFAAISAAVLFNSASKDRKQDTTEVSSEDSNLTAQVALHGSVSDLRLMMTLTNRSETEVFVEEASGFPLCELIVWNVSTGAPCQPRSYGRPGLIMHNGKRRIPSHDSAEWEIPIGNRFLISKGSYALSVSMQVGRYGGDETETTVLTLADVEFTYE